jgi:hypothetical protein
LDHAGACSNINQQAALSSGAMCCEIFCFNKNSEQQQPLWSSADARAAQFSSNKDIVGSAVGQRCSFRTVPNLRPKKKTQVATLRLNLRQLIFQLEVSGGF